MRTSIVVLKHSQPSLAFHNRLWKSTSTFKTFVRKNPGNQRNHRPVVVSIRHKKAHQKPLCRSINSVNSQCSSIISINSSVVLLIVLTAVYSSINSGAKSAVYCIPGTVYCILYTVYCKWEESNNKVGKSCFWGGDVSPCMCVLSSYLFWTSDLWTHHQTGSHRRNVIQDLYTFLLRCLPQFLPREGFSHPFPLSTVKSNFCVPTN